ncbi:hypothetical protein ANN_26858 [Periplaneta americana]|uniref:Uncharacterized protein n=1 Tax=Periplaneta americana TaxID=6978 RepID=A0ABQ8RZA3_PERAM|nr:hypothetical protein ANN_26858 [Periplaneta americana]
MAGLCEGGNEPPGSVKANSIKTADEQSIGYYETKKKKPWFDEDRCIVVERRKQTKLKFLQDPLEENRDNYFNERREASRKLRKEKQWRSVNGISCFQQNASKRLNSANVVLRRTAVKEVLTEDHRIDRVTFCRIHTTIHGKR